MSSALLYLAIVVVWGIVLVPMWLRRESTHPHGARGRRFTRRRPPETDDATDDALPQDAETETVIDETHAASSTHPQSPIHAYDTHRAGHGYDPLPRHESQRPGPPPGPNSYGPDPSDRGDTRPPGPSDRRAPAPAGASDRHDAHPPGVSDRRDMAHPPGASRRREIAIARRRAKIIARRRRRTTVLLTLTIAAATLAGTDLTPWWIVPIPVLLLAGHLALLRAAAAADVQRAHAEAARRAAERRRHEATRAAEETRAETTMVHPSAEIIDFTAHTREEIYDQYADAEKRAVND